MWDKKSSKQGAAYWSEMVCQGNETRAKTLDEYEKKDELVDVFIPKKKDDNIVPDNNEKILATSKWTKLIKVVKPEKNNAI